MRTAAIRIGVAILLVAVFAVVAGTGEGVRLPVPVLVLVLGADVAVPAIAMRRSASVDVRWSGGRDAPAAPMAHEPAAAARPGGAGVARSLARVESGRLASGPWFAVGLAFWLLIALMFGWVYAKDADRSWWSMVWITPMLCHPFVGCLLVGAHRNRTRAVRDGCDELFATCPATEDARTAGHLATAWVGALGCVAGVVTVMVLIAVRNDRVYGPIDGVAVATILTCAALGAGGVVLGVALGRWVRWSLAPVVAVAVVAVIGARLNRIGDPSWATDRLLATFVATSGVDPIFLPRPEWARVAWFAALAVLVATSAFSLRRSRPAAVTAAVAAAVAVVAGVLIVRPASPAAVDRVAARVLRPAASERCVDAGSGVRACAYTEYRDAAALAAARLRPVAASLPRAAVEGTTVMQWFDQEVGEAPAEVRAAIGRRSPSTPPGALRLRFSTHPEALQAARLRLVTHALGLPVEVGGDGMGTVVAGEARGIVVLWAAAQGLDRGAALRTVREVQTHGEPADATARAAVWPGLCSGEGPVLQWSPTDLVAARAVLRLPAAEVRRVVARDWERIRDPAMTTDDLLEALGLPPVGAPEPVERRAVGC
jgi:hypothetical protein